MKLNITQGQNTSQILSIKFNLCIDLISVLLLGPDILYGLQVKGFKLNKILDLALIHRLHLLLDHVQALLDLSYSDLAS